jgi:hypothetical protein
VEKCGYTGGLEAMETVSVMPVSLVSSLKGFQSGKIPESLCMMLKGTLDDSCRNRLGKDHG